MGRYIIRPRSDDWCDCEEGQTARHLYEEQDEPLDTGLVDTHGHPLFRVSDKRPIGFVMKGKADAKGT